MGSYEISRSARVAASPAVVHALLDDFHQWPAWSPWEELDPQMRRSYSGAEKGLGAHYEWSGNKKAGSGSMRITGSTPSQVDVHLSFVKPFKSESDVQFTLVPVETDGAPGTDVTWVMRGRQQGLAALMGKLVPMERLVGKDMEKGLARIGAVAEQG